MRDVETLARPASRGVQGPISAHQLIFQLQSCSTGAAGPLNGSGEYHYNPNI